MNSSEIFIGNLRKCTEYELRPVVIEGKVTSVFSSVVDSEFYKSDVVLIKIGKDSYLPLDKVDDFFEYIKILRDFKVNGISSNGVILPSRPMWKNGVFVDADTLRPYFKDNEVNTVHIKSLKKSVNKKY